MYLFRTKLKISSAQVILFGFLAIILTGALLLMLPVASADGRSADLTTALFTSASAVCVTGLVVRDTATGWTLFGQVVILLLIQVGGMGVIMTAISAAMLSGRRIGLMQRSALADSISAPQVGGIVRYARFILKGILTVELTGMLVMAPVFVRDFGVAQGLWMALFHAVSAFCNAGLDLMGVRGAYSSLTSYASDPVINITVMLLIVIGGLGFLTWKDIVSHGFRISKYRLQSKVILTTTALLIAIPAVLFYFFEFSSMPVGTRILCSLFQSVTPRTAGFNTVDLGAMSDDGKVLMILLMLIGGSPGSTAGGMKTTTFAVLVVSALCVFRQKSDSTVFGRRIEENTIRYALSILLMYLTLFLSAAFIISRAEGLPVLDCCYETASAIGTVGLTLGITPHLHTLSRLLLIALMYFGRVGGLTLIYATIPGIRTGGAKLPAERLTVG
ncbi:MAG: Trk family potassium uptake protein [Lachnospiraceae bacterium]|jgi:trk system potassium uptake protein TrkH|nr:Trk family potassium uptake protein [Lachnospiraceae bacterium]